MIDIHSHIVFDVDDGPDELEESLNLIGESYSQGVRKIVSTSHRRKDMFETPEEVILENFLKVKEKAEALYPDLQLFYGGELYFSDELLIKLKNKQVPHMNDTRFALIEFSMGTPWRTIHSALRDVLMSGVTPIVAHIERYNALAFNKERVREIIDMGCYTQINSVHVLKTKLFIDQERVFKKRAHYFLEHDLVHCVASDMHNLTKRPPYMKQAYQIIEKKFGQDRANRLFVENPQTLLENQEI